MQNRRANLDLLRTAAITIVIFFHISQYIKGLTAFEYKFFALGTLGVDIFFVLSGWLIGGIFFKEYYNNGNVNISKFWGRRWLRTLPPYYIVLLFSWFSVHFSRKQNFDFGYLLFFQNFYKTLPYFLISWSLCVEEQFYIFLPIILFIGLKYDLVISMCLTILCLTFSSRIVSSTDAYPSFGYLLTATHLRLDGLILGVLLSYIFVIKKRHWNKISLLFKVSGIVLGLVGVGLYFMDSNYMYSLGLLFFSLFFSAILCICVDSPDWSFAKLPLINRIAVSSYSLYLTHSLSIHLVEHFYKESNVRFFIVSLLIIMIVGYSFYYFIERLTIKLRDRFLPQSERNKKNISYS